MLNFKKSGLFFSVLGLVLICFQFTAIASAPKLIAMGEHHICAITNGGVRCLGKNDVGQTDVPAGLVNPFHISVGHDNSCVLDDGGLHCWGRIAPKYIAPSHLINPTQVSLGRYHSCVLDDTGVQCWGGR